jgi:hypothetical protein
LGAEIWAFASARIYDAEAGTGEIRFTTVLFSGGAEAPAAPQAFRVPETIIRDSNPPDPQLEAARLQAWYEDRLQSFREAQKDWEQELAEMMRRNKAEWDRQRAAEEAREYEEQREVQHLEYMFAAAAVKPAPRRWWQQLLRLGGRGGGCPPGGVHPALLTRRRIVGMGRSREVDPGPPSTRDLRDWTATRPAR